MKIFKIFLITLCLGALTSVVQADDVATALDLYFTKHQYVTFSASISETMKSSHATFSPNKFLLVSKMPDKFRKTYVDQGGIVSISNGKFDAFVEGGTGHVISKKIVQNNMAELTANSWRTLYAPNLVSKINSRLKIQLVATSAAVVMTKFILEIDGNTGQKYSLQVLHDDGSSTLSQFDEILVGGIYVPQHTSLSLVKGGQNTVSMTDDYTDIVVNGAVSDSLFDIP